MPGWTLVSAHPTLGRIFQRPLDAFELTFLWYGLFDGTSDSIQHYELRLLNGSRDTHLFATPNIIRAWLSAKRRYPLAGALIRGDGNSPLRFSKATNSQAKDADGGGENIAGFTSQAYFVIREHDLSVLRPHEVVFGSVVGAEEAHQQAAAILDGPRPLSDELLMQLYVFRETKRTDVIHMMALVSHCMTDMVATHVFMRCLLDTLARGGSSEPPQIPLEDRLAMAVPSIDLEPMHLRSLSLARRRWRRAAALVVLRLKQEKRQGGQTLPCRITRSSPYVPARPGRVVTSLTLLQSATVLANCRLHHITFGNAHPVLAQVALTRVLYRRYLRGEISDEEWEYRKKQPYNGVGPLNLRPYLDKEWFDRGGGGEFMLSTSCYFYQLPFMTLGATTERHGQERVLSDGAPPFSDLLSFDRFLHRALLVKKQVTAFFSHPLFFEIIHALNHLSTEPARLCALQWMKRVEAGDDNCRYQTSDTEELSVMDMPLVWIQAASSLGNVDLIFPSKYPLPPTHPLSPYSPTPHPGKAGYIIPSTSTSSPSISTSEIGMDTKIVAEHAAGCLRVFPLERYLGASSSRGQLNLDVVYDRNVFGDGIMREWTDEIKEAVLWYLGRPHPDRRARQSRGDDGKIGLAEGVRANL